MQLIGITGGIGAGKSVVSRILRCKGFSVYDCDVEARRLMDASDTLKSELAVRLGQECITAKGEFDRKKIASIVFADSDAREWLNSKVHAMVRHHLSACLKCSEHKLFFVESAILKTSGLLEMCNRIWLVDASVETRLIRVGRRDNASEKDIIARMKSQSHEFSDFGNVQTDIIVNDDDRSLLSQIERALSVLGH